MSIVVTTGPDALPVSLDELKAHSRIVTSDEDDVLEACLDAAVTHAETELQCRFIRQTITWKLDRGFPAYFVVPQGPMVDVTSITYTDEAGATQTLATSQYVVDASHDPGRIYPAYDVTWPTTRWEPNAVTVVYRAGYGTSASDVPLPLRRAILMHAGHLFEHREAWLNTNLGMVEVPMGYGALIHPYRNWSF